MGLLFRSSSPTLCFLALLPSHHIPKCKREMALEGGRSDNKDGICGSLGRAGHFWDTKVASLAGGREVQSTRKIRREREALDNLSHSLC